MAAMMGMKRSRPINNAANVLSVLFLLLTTQFALCRAGFHYEAPSDCQWTMMNSSSSTSSTSSMSSSMATSSDGSGSSGHSGLLPMAGVAGPNDVALHCRLRTINSQFDQTNFSVVPREHTASLTIECSDSLLYQR
jgi:hypothetical protein